MAVNPYPVQQQILAEFTAQLAQPVVSGGVPTLENLMRVDGVVQPYVILHFSSPHPSAADRSFGGARRDGTYSYVDAICVSPTDDITRAIAGNVQDKMLGYKGDDMGELNGAPGGGDFIIMDTYQKPEAFIQVVSFQYQGNTVIA